MENKLDYKDELAEIRRQQKELAKREKALKSRQFMLYVLVWVKL